jgi:PAS domain S-box-containing protein
MRLAAGVGPISGLDAGMLATLLDAVPDGLAVVDGQGRILVVNERLEQLSGYPVGQLAGRSVEALLPDAARARHRRLRAGYGRDARLRMMGEGRSLQLRRYDDTLVPVEISLSPTTMDGVEVVIAAVRDVTARQAADERERIVSEALDSVADGVVVIDSRSGRRLYANQAALDNTGYTREELAALPIGLPSTPAERSRIDRAIASVVAGEVTQATLDSHVRHRSGSRLPVEMKITFRSDPAEAAGVGRLTLIIRDTTDRLAAELRLRSSEQSFRTAFEQAPIGVAIVRLDAEGHRREILRANPALAEMFGETVDGLIGRNLSEFTLPGDERRTAAAAVDLAAGRRLEVARVKGYRRRDGSVLWVDGRASTVSFPDLAGPTVLVQLVDVTEQQLADRSRAQRTATAEVVAQVTTGVLADQSPDATFQQIVDGVARVFGADDVTLGVPDHDTGDVVILAAHGPVSTAVKAGEISMAPDVARRLATLPTTLLPERSPDPTRPDLPTLGPGAAARFELAETGTGVIAIARPHGADPVTEADAALLAALIRQLALAVELGRARVGQARLAVLEDRQRLARDLHDTVIQDLIAIGMQLHVDAGQIGDPARRERHLTVLDQLDETVRRLRSTVFDLTAPTARPTLTGTVRGIAAQAARALGHQPTVTIEGGVAAVHGPVADQVAAVLREALSNVARHAMATRTRIIVSAHGGWVTLTVEDDGIGLPKRRRRGDGIANVRHRAAALGGRATVTRRAAPETGTRLVWSVPVPDLSQPG